MFIYSEKLEAKGEKRKERCDFVNEKCSSEEEEGGWDCNFCKTASVRCRIFMAGFYYLDDVVKSNALREQRGESNEGSI